VWSSSCGGACGVVVAWGLWTMSSSRTSSVYVSSPRGTAAARCGHKPVHDDSDSGPERDDDNTGTVPRRHDDDAGTEPMSSLSCTGSTEPPRGDDAAAEPLCDDENLGEESPHGSDSMGTWLPHTRTRAQLPCTMTTWAQSPCAMLTWDSFPHDDDAGTTPCAMITMSTEPLRDDDHEQ